MSPNVPEIDLGFAVSATATGSDETFKQMKEVIKETVDKYGSSKIRYSVITFSTTATTQIGFAEKFQTDNVLKKAIDSVPKTRGGSALATALEEARNVFHTAAANRPGTKKVLIVLTDKRSDNSEEELKNASLLLKNLQVRIITIPIGDKADSKELQGITASPRDVIATKETDTPRKTSDDIMERIRDGKVSFLTLSAHISM